MPITQREMDIMQMDAQLSIRQIVEEWRRTFFRQQAPTLLEPIEPTEEVLPETPQEVEY